MKKLILLLIIPFISQSQTTSSGESDAAGILLNGIVSAESNQIKNVADPIDAQDAATKNYVDNNVTSPEYSIGYEPELGGYVFMISANESGFRLAPPTSPPSMSGCLTSSAEFSGFMLPPYRILTFSAESAEKISARTFRI